MSITTLVISILPVQNFSVQVKYKKQDEFFK
jgi:hypothetical protein